VEKRVPAGEEVALKFNEIADKAMNLMAELQLLDMETQKFLEDEAERLGLKDIAESYDFGTNEFILKDVSDTGGAQGPSE
jgi:hypothetical protein